MTEEEVRKLAELARIELTEEEVKGLQNDFEAILGYVSQVTDVAENAEEGLVGVPHNVMREDENPHEKGAHTEAITEQFPNRDGDYLKVKKIISQD